MKKGKHYIGIDLGTTNSSIAFVNRQRDGSIRPVNIRIKQIDANEGSTRDLILPSVVYFDNTIRVGKHAKSRRTLFPRKVISSVKNWMGTDKIFDVSGMEVSPIEVSARILQKLKGAAEEMLQTEIKDVVVAVPASFDNDMRADTLAAMKLAGFRVEDEDGTPLNVLIDEPRAALFDLLNKQERGEIPTTLLDKGETKNILVYDLGGGTLDVSMHCVTISENGDIDVEDLAISRYTQIGGDVFDQRVADWMLNDFLQKNPSISWDEVDDIQKKEVMTRLLEQAEKVKFELSMDREEDIMWGGIGDVVTISPGYLLDDKIYQVDFTMDLYREIVRDLLGEELEYDNYQFIEDIDDDFNIIYPILDVLRKAYDKKGEEPMIDLVLLTGGMSDFSLVQKELKRIFDREPYQIVEPIFAVSRGAALYHYMRENQHYEYNPILNETIQLGLNNNVLYPLITEGTVLPVKRKIEDTFIMPKDTSLISIPIYRGERRKSLVLMRSVFFKLPGKHIGGTEVEAMIEVNQNKIISFTAWLVDNPTVRLSVEIKATEREKVEPNVTEPALAEKVEPQKKKESAAPIPQQREIDISKIIERFDRAVRNNSEKESKVVEEEMVRALNAVKFLRFLMTRYSNINNGFIKDKRLPIVISAIMVRHPDNEYVDNFENVLRRKLQLGRTFREQLLTTRVFGALVAVGRMKFKNFSPILRELYRQKDSQRIMNILLTTIGKVGDGVEDIEICTRELRSSRVGNKIIAAWSIGKLASLQKESPIDRYLFSDASAIILREINRYVNRSVQWNLNYVRNLIFAVGEIYDNRFNSNPTVDKTREEFIYALTGVIERKEMFVLNTQDPKYMMFLGLKGLAATVIKMLQGKKLTEMEEAVLLDLRNRE